jgi:hypothetical protein
MKKFYLALMGMTLLCTSTFSQKVNTDSLTLVSKISNDQLKLGKLLNEMGDKTRAMQDDSAKAQQSADDNKIAANRLGDDAQDKKLARQADNRAGDARSDSRKARNSRDKLDRLKQEIQNLQGKIAGNQRRLDQLVNAENKVSVLAPISPAQVVPVFADTTQHP